MGQGLSCVVYLQPRGYTPYTPLCTPFNLRPSSLILWPPTGIRRRSCANTKGRQLESGHHAGNGFPHLAFVRYTGISPFPPLQHSGPLLSIAVALCPRVTEAGFLLVGAAEPSCKAGGGDPLPVSPAVSARGSRFSRPQVGDWGSDLHGGKLEAISSPTMFSGRTLIILGNKLSGSAHERHRGSCALAASFCEDQSPMIQNKPGC
jgi:hypothetical protein